MGKQGHVLRCRRRIGIVVLLLLSIVTHLALWLSCASMNRGWFSWAWCIANFAIDEANGLDDYCMGDLGGKTGICSFVDGDA